MPQQKKTANRSRLGNPLAAVYCPSRRGSQLYPFTSIGSRPIDSDAIPDSPGVPRSDYGANIGVRKDDTTENPLGCQINGVGYPSSYPLTSAYSNWGADTKVTWSGVVFQRSNISDAQIKDGTSHTYLFGEKFVDSMHNDDGMYEGDADTVFSGYGNDNYRTTLWNTINGSKTAMANDQKDLGDATDSKGPRRCLFGSPHSGLVNFAYCDGSTHTVPVGIDVLIHRYLGERNDGQIIDDSAF
jgi:prepilin-type processing-associated H-X9-DG protein